MDRVKKRRAAAKGRKKADRGKKKAAAIRQYGYFGKPLHLKPSREREEAVPPSSRAPGAEGPD